MSLFQIDANGVVWRQSFYITVYFKLRKKDLPSTGIKSSYEPVLNPKWMKGKIHKEYKRIQFQNCVEEKLCKEKTFPTWKFGIRFGSSCFYCENLLQVVKYNVKIYITYVTRICDYFIAGLYVSSERNFQTLIPFSDREKLRCKFSRKGFRQVIKYWLTCSRVLSSSV